jgi:hypothetical protein
MWVFPGSKRLNPKSCGSKFGYETSRLNALQAVMLSLFVTTVVTEIITRIVTVIIRSKYFLYKCLQLTPRGFEPLSQP